MRVEKLDVTSVRDREMAFGWEIDVLVNNAGVMEAGPIAEQPAELLRAMLEVNFFGGLEVIQGFARQFARKRRGKIVIMSSVAGLTTAPFAAGYCATKHALEAVAEALKMEARAGIKVATINPGAYGTGFNDRGGDSIRWYDPGAELHPAGQLRGPPGCMGAPAPSAGQRRRHRGCRPRRQREVQKRPPRRRRWSSSSRASTKRGRR
jgi:short-subunit dehydrogenase